jgi:hypothetical protein
MAILRKCSLICDDIIFNDFYIPIVAAEIKTNLDKTMLSGIEHSVESLKRTFPKCLYYVIAELSDFNYKDQNYAATGIDEMYVLRKQKRSSVRRTGSRSNIDSHLIKTILENIVAAMRNCAIENQSLQERMSKGKLISGGSHDT